MMPILKLTTYFFVNGLLVFTIAITYFFCAVGIGAGVFDEHEKGTTRLLAFFLGSVIASFLTAVLWFYPLPYLDYFFPQ
jgi:hypothetical protein